MGTDIHMVIEARRSGVWTRATVERKCSWCSGTGKNERDDSECYWCKGTKIERHGGAYGDRNYDAFAILADVRNGTGFAGCDTGDGFIPIAPQRGIPGDVCQELRAATSAKEGEAVDYDAIYEAGLDIGEHSFSWLTLSELVKFPHWERTTTTKRGVVTLDEFAAFEAAGGKKAPASYCGGMTGQLVYEVSEETMRGLVRDLSEQIRQKKYFAERHGHKVEGQPIFVTTVSWVETYKEAAGALYSEFIPALVKMADSKGLSHDDVRIVFGFDS